MALFDYDPEIMSPNVDALDEELPFREGQIIKVIILYCIVHMTVYYNAQYIIMFESFIYALA